MPDEITPAEFQRLLEQEERRGGKFPHARTDLNGHTFDSEAEAHRYASLKMLLLAEPPEISDLRVHPMYLLQREFTDRWGNVHASITHTPDLSYRVISDGHLVVEDVKGSKWTKTDAWSVRMRLFCYQYPNIEYRVVDDNGDPI